MLAAHPPAAPLPVIEIYGLQEPNQPPVRIRGDTISTTTQLQQLISMYDKRRANREAHPMNIKVFNEFAGAYLTLKPDGSKLPFDKQMVVKVAVYTADNAAERASAGAYVPAAATASHSHALTPPPSDAHKGGEAKRKPLDELESAAKRRASIPTPAASAASSSGAASVPPQQTEATSRHASAAALLEPGARTAQPDFAARVSPVEFDDSSTKNLTVSSSASASSPRPVATTAKFAAAQQHTVAPAAVPAAPPPPPARIDSRRLITYPSQPSQSSILTYPISTDPRWERARAGLMSWARQTDQRQRALATLTDML